MRIVEARERSVRLEAAIKNSLVDFSSMTVSVVALVSDVRRGGRPLVGLGFNSIGRYAQSGMLCERFIPRLLEGGDLFEDSSTGAFDPARVRDVLMRNEKPGGHGERSTAVAALELAAWDLAAKLEEVPLYRYLADRYRDGEADSRVEVYAAGGYYQEGHGIGALREEMQGYLDLGYTHLKMKIGGAPLDEDLRRLEAVLELVPDGGHLAVDANGRFDLETALAYGEALQPYGLRWYEEPGDPLDYALHAELAERYEQPLATGENLFSAVDLVNLLRFGGGRSDRDVIQVDPGLSYGLTELLRMLEGMREEGWRATSIIPHGGHSMALHIAAGLGLGGNESYPGIFQPFGGFGARHEVVDGAIEVSDSPGFGLEDKAELRPVLSELL